MKKPHSGGQLAAVYLTTCLASLSSCCPWYETGPQKATLCPRQIGHLHDHFRPHPVHALQLECRAEARLARRRLVERHALHLQRSKHAGQAL